jgi:DNA-binding CsgD family transcriptional regulator
MPVERAHTLIVAAGIARRARRRTEARELLDEARFEMERCGALGYLPGVRAEQERLGDRAEVNALTKTERKIADLVAEGLTNAEVAALLYVSARTVEAHLTKIYRKEGVRGRAELASRHRT